MRLLNLIDEHTRECLADPCGSGDGQSSKVIDALADVMVMKGVPEHLRSDNGPEFVAKDLRKWLASTGAKTLYIEPGSPWENGYCESFNSKLRDEFLNGEIFYSIKEAAACWPNDGASTTTRFGHTPRWVTGHRHRGVADKPEGAWRSGNRYAFPLLHTPDGDAYLNSAYPRYTNSSTGTKDRALQ